MGRAIEKFHTLKGYKIEYASKLNLSVNELRPGLYIEKYVSKKSRNEVYTFFSKYEEIKYLLFIKNYEKFDLEIAPLELKYKNLTKSEKKIVNTLRLPLLALKEYFLKNYNASIKIMKEAIENEWLIGDDGYQSYYSQAIQHYIYIAKIYLKQCLLDVGFNICRDVLEYIYTLNKYALSRTVKIKFINTSETSVICDRVGIALQLIPYQLMFSNLYKIEENEIFHKLFYKLNEVKVYEEDEKILKKWIFLKNDLINIGDELTIKNSYEFVKCNIDKKFDTAKLSIIKSIIEIGYHNEYQQIDKLRSDLNDFVNANLKVSSDNKVFLWVK